MYNEMETLTKQLVSISVSTASRKEKQKLPILSMDILRSFLIFRNTRSIFAPFL